MPIGVAPAEARGDPRLRRRGRARRPRRRRDPRGRRRVRRAHRRRAHPAVRPPRRDRRAGHRRPRDPRGTCPTSTRSSCPIGGGGLISGVAAAVAAARAASGRGARDRRAGGERRRLPAVAARRRGHHRGRRIRRSPTASPSRTPGSDHLRDRLVARSTRSSRSPTTRPRARCSCCSSGRSSSSSPPAPSGSRPCSPGKVRPTRADRRGALRRQHRPADDGAGDQPRARRIRPLPDPADRRCPTGPASSRSSPSVIADANANVVEVLHTRHGNGMQIGEVADRHQRRDARARAPRSGDRTLAGLRLRAARARDLTRDRAVPEIGDTPRGARAACRADSDPRDAERGSGRVGVDALDLDGDRAAVRRRVGDRVADRGPMIACPSGLASL